MQQWPWLTITETSKDKNRKLTAGFGNIENMHVRGRSSFSRVVRLEAHREWMGWRMMRFENIGREWKKWVVIGGQIEFRKIFLCIKWEIHSSLGIDWSDPLIRREFSLGKEQKWSSLMVQQWRAHLPKQGTWVRSLVWEYSTCHGATKHMSPSYWSPPALEPVLHSKRSHCNEGPMQGLCN